MELISLSLTIARTTIFRVSIPATKLFTVAIASAGTMMVRQLFVTFMRKGIMRW